jgi:hypothetical protein
MLGFLKRQWSRQDGMDDTEHGGAGANAKRQREHGHGGEAGVLQQLAAGELESFMTQALSNPAIRAVFSKSP